MQPFNLTLADGGQVCGRLSNIPKLQENARIPLLVCLHGGSYDAEYFDVNEEYSIATISRSMNIPVVAISRPGYGGSTPMQPAALGSQDTYAQQQGKYLDSVVLPAVWAEFGIPNGAAAVVILAHSIGAMIATVMVGSHNEASGYPLAGLITSGIGSELSPGPQKLSGDILASAPETITFDAVMKDALMLQLPGKDLTSTEMTKYTKHLNKPIPAGEYRDINTTWLQYWHQYSHRVKVPLKYGLSEFDELWVSSNAALASYCAAFPMSPRIESEIVYSAPHCIELSHKSKAWLTRCCGFAQECVEWRNSGGAGTASKESGAE
ncbi:Alpha/Beta hydrolase protein [Mariannaea sp. PMI_226]|nr:Alpha/Beta hydrolase protein [Mariannaea sp. PMI_226]